VPLPPQLILDRIKLNRFISRLQVPVGSGPRPFLTPLPGPPSLPTNPGSDGEILGGGGQWLRGARRAVPGLPRRTGPQDDDTIQDTVYFRHVAIDDQAEAADPTAATGTSARPPPLLHSH